MQLRGIDFGYVMNASGGRNFFGQGYPFHYLWKPFGLDYTGATFVAKSTPLHLRAGHMPLITGNLYPVEPLPVCIRVKFRKKVVLNAVGLSSTGARDLFERRLWQKWKDPFFLSFASIGDSVMARLKEWEDFVRLASHYLLGFSGHVGLEANLFCPNTGAHDKSMIDEICDTLDIAADLGIPLVAKINVLVSHDVALRIQDHKACDAICNSNTIKFGEMSDRIDWEKLWGIYGSPLKKFGGGGLSGAPLFPLVVEWIKEARKKGFYKPIVACGGILSSQDARCMFDAGADAIQIGSVSILRPWRVQGIIASANAYAHGLFFPVSGESSFA